MSSAASFAPGAKGRAVLRPGAGRQPMRILAVTDAERWFSFHLVGSLIDAGHEVETFITGPGAGEFYGRSRQVERIAKNQVLLEHARRMIADGGLDLIVCYVYDDFLTRTYARKLEALSIPMVNYNVDMVNQWYRQTNIAPYFTLMLCAQRANMDNMRKYGARVLYFPMAARPPVVARETDFSPAEDVTFVGTPMDYRIRVLSEVSRAGIPLAVYGQLWNERKVSRPVYKFEKTVSDLYHYGWARFRGEGQARLLQLMRNRLAPDSGQPSLDPSLIHGRVPDAALDDLFRRSKINIGITRMIGENPNKLGVNQVKLRDFEVTLAGGFHLVEESEDHAELFAVGAEIETWRNPAELIDKSRFYLANESRRTCIADAGRRRALSEHTWKHRFDLLFRTLGLA